MAFISTRPSDLIGLSHHPGREKRAGLRNASLLVKVSCLESGRARIKFLTIWSWALLPQFCILQWGRSRRDEEHSMGSWPWNDLSVLSHKQEVTYMQNTLPRPFYGTFQEHGTTWTWMTLCFWWSVVTKIISKMGAMPTSEGCFGEIRWDHQSDPLLAYCLWLLLFRYFFFPFHYREYPHK